MKTQIHPALLLISFTFVGSATLATTYRDVKASDTELSFSKNLVMPLSETKIREVQDALNHVNNAGLKVDGNLNPETIAAIKTFQTQVRQPPTGILDSQTLAFLGVSQTTSTPLEREPASVSPAPKGIFNVPQTETGARPPYPREKY